MTMEKVNDIIVVRGGGDIASGAIQNFTEADSEFLS